MSRLQNGARRTLRSSGCMNAKCLRVCEAPRAERRRNSLCSVRASRGHPQARGRALSAGVLDAGNVSAVPTAGPLLLFLLTRPASALGGRRWHALGLLHATLCSREDATNAKPGSGSSTISFGDACRLRPSEVRRPPASSRWASSGWLYHTAALRQPRFVLFCFLGYFFLFFVFHLAGFTFFRFSIGLAGCSFSRTSSTVKS